MTVGHRTLKSQHSNLTVSLTKMGKRSISTVSTNFKTLSSQFEKTYRLEMTTDLVKSGLMV